MASSVADDELLRERCARYRSERDTAYSDVDQFKDANSRLSVTVRDVEETVARLRRERNEAQDKLTELREQVRKGQPPPLQTGRKKTQLERRHNRNFGSNPAKSAPVVSRKWVQGSVTCPLSVIAPKVCQTSACPRERLEHV